MADAKLIVQRLFEEPWTGNMDVIDELVAPDYVGYDRSEPEPIRGPDGLRGVHPSSTATRSPTARITVDEQIAEGDKVATRWTARGTQAGEIAGHRADRQGRHGRRA